MRQHNLSLALATILDDGHATRTGLARRMGLSKPAVTRIVGDLIDAGFVTELGPEPAVGRGRPASRLVPRADGHAFLGIDLRLDRLLIQARNLTGDLIAETGGPESPPASSADLVRRLVATVQNFADSLGPPVAAIGVAVGGAVDERGERIVRAVHAAWHDVPLSRHLRDAVRGSTIPVRLSDVARCAASGNWREVSGDPSVQDLVHLQIGVGVGAGWVRRWQGTPDPRVPGTIAHLPLDPNGTRCSCGARGCLDAMVGFPALVKLAARRGVEATTKPPTMPAFCRELGDRAARGDNRAETVIEQMAGRIARAAAIFMTLYQPSRFTIGGYPLLLGELFQRAFVRAAKPHVPDVENVVTTTGLGDEASVVGAHLLGVAAVTEDPLQLRQ